MNSKYAKRRYRLVVMLSVGILAGDLRDSLFGTGTRSATGAAALRPVW